MALSLRYHAFIVTHQYNDYKYALCNSFLLIASFDSLCNSIKIELAELTVDTSAAAVQLCQCHCCPGLLLANT
jgi:hypothetical protein